MIMIIVIITTVAQSVGHLVAHKMLTYSPLCDMHQEMHSIPWQEDPGIQRRDDESSGSRGFTFLVQLGFLLSITLDSFPCQEA